MKTRIYLRVSLLIPLLVWGLSLMFFMFASRSQVLAQSQPASIATWLFRFMAFYTFGIIIWIFPYLLLAFILLAMSFRMETQNLFKVFALSPIAMTLITVSLATLIVLSIPGTGIGLTNPILADQNVLSVGILLMIVSLLWGYVCVGTGFAIYKLLQRQHFIRDEEIVATLQSA